MTSRSTHFNSVVLNDVRYTISGPVISELAAQLPEQINIGEKSAKNLRNRNTIIWDGFHRGALQRDIIDLEADVNKAWVAYAGIRTVGHTVLPPLATATAAVSGSPTSCSTLGVRNSTVYGTFNGTDVRAYNNGTDSWGASLDTLPAAATDVINVRMGGTEYIVWATTSGYTYYNGSSFTDDTKDAKYLAFWDERLWGIDNTGQLWWSKDIGTEFDDAQLPLPDGSVQGLFVGRSTNAGRLVLYVSTTRGLYVHDADANVLVPIDPEVPEHQDNGLGFLRYLDSTYYSAGLGIYRFVNSPSQADVSVMGLDRRGGLPSDHAGTITKLVASHQEVIALVNDASNEPAIYGWRPHEVVRYGEVEDPHGAWQMLWDSGATGTEVDTMLATTAYDTYRLWWSYGGTIYYMALPRDVLNPLELSTYNYASSGEVITPHLDGQEISDNKLAVELFVNAINATATETIVVDYEINESGSWVNLGTITASGITTYSLASGVGVAFNRIRFRFTFARGGTTTNTPDLGKVEFHWLRPIDVKWRHTFTIKWEGIPEFGRTAENQLDQLINAAGSITLLDFTFRNRDADDDGASNPYNAYVKVMALRLAQTTGNQWDGAVEVTVEEI